jgi:uncharacterized membrane protein
MIILILGLVLFFGVHSVRMVAGGFRERQLAANAGRWKGLYALVSLVGFGLIIWGWIVFRPVAPEIYTPPEWGRQAAWAFVLVAFILLPTAYLPAGYLKRWVKHPMLTAVILWSIGHLLANGDLASLLLFGPFLVYAVANRIAVISRDEPAPATVTPRSDGIAIIVGALAFVVFALWLHTMLFGVGALGPLA